MFSSSLHTLHILDLAFQVHVTKQHELEVLLSNCHIKIVTPCVFPITTYQMDPWGCVQYRWDLDLYVWFSLSGVNS